MLISGGKLSIAARPRLALRSRARRFCRRGISILLIVVTLLSQSGCTTSLRDWIGNGFKVGPNYCKPPAPVAEDWIKEKGQEIENRHIVHWWTVFEDKKLNGLIETAYRQNLSLRVAGTRVLQARAQQAIAVGGLFPQSQQAFLQYSRVNLSPNTANNVALLSTLFPGAPVTNFFSDWQTGFNLSWELDVWGRFRRNIESANAELDVSVEDYDAVLVTLLADVATNYTRFRTAQQRIAIARANVKIQEDVLALASEKFRVGTATKLDVEQARTVLEQTRSLIPAFEIVQGQANDILCTLLGVPPRDLSTELGPPPAIDASPLVNTPKWVAAGVPADLMRQRPDIRSAERQIAAQSAQIGVAEAELYPSFYINGTIGYESQDLSDLLSSQSFMGSIVPNFRWNVLNYGRVLNNVRLEQARTLELIANYQNTVLTAGRETQTALRTFHKSHEQATDLRRAVQAASAATQLSLEQYRTGTVPFNTVFNLETTQVQQQDQLALVRGNIALGLIDVYRALGGGWEIRLTPPGDTVDVRQEPTIERLPPPSSGESATPGKPDPLQQPPHVVN
ncbi:MAG: efflux transporter outer membrane subunit [Pirellulales bacterium]